ncbi:HAD hydrolase-like protein, partial [Salmonella enterica]|uniref:HAD hydrolase-like protein n=1 Tax=Salmonella enterica TaxID=28901 RepID=UPI000CC96689
NKIGYNKTNILIVGDQILTDIIGANNIGIESVLVKPIMNSDAWNTRINRFIELRIMKLVLKKDPKMKWSRSLNDPIE